ncbi:MAG TPA: hypothetical protein VNO84_08875 [Burkholderiaceae bacterium]|nr:hypothetical protein [Burkholderiaceae bacterium]
MRETREVRGVRRSDLGEPPGHPPEGVARDGDGPPGAVLVRGSQWRDVQPQLKALAEEGDVFLYMYRFARNETVDLTSPLDLGTGPQLVGWGMQGQGMRRGRWLGQGDPDGPPGFNLLDPRYGLSDRRLAGNTYLVISRTPPGAVREAGGFQGVRWIGDDAGQLSVRGLAAMHIAADPAAPAPETLPEGRDTSASLVNDALARAKQSGKELQQASETLQKAEAKAKQLEDRLHHRAERLRARERDAHRLMREAREAEARAEAARHTDDARLLQGTAQRLRKEADAEAARLNKEREAMIKDVEALAAAEVKAAQARVDETAARRAFMKDQHEFASLAQSRGEADARAARQHAERARAAADEVRGRQAFIARTVAARAERRARAIEGIVEGLAARTGRIEDGLAVSELAHKGAQQKLQRIQAETTEAVRHFKQFLEDHGEPTGVPATRRVLDLPAAAAATQEARISLERARDALAQARAQHDAAKAYETARNAEAHAAWTAHGEAHPDPHALSREELQPLLRQAVEARLATHATGRAAAELKHAGELVKALELAYQRAQEAEAAVRDAVAFSPHGVDEATVTRRAGRGDALLGQVTRSIVDDKTIAAGRALVGYDEACAEVTSLLDAGPETAPGMPRTVRDGLTYSDPEHPAYPDLPENFWPNIGRREPHRYLNRIERSALALVNAWPVGKNAYEQLYGVKLRPGDFKVDPAVVERTEIPGGLEHVIADIHAHDRGYDHRAASQAERDGLRERMTLLNDGWRAAERYFYAVKPLTETQKHASATSRILHGSIPQMSDCGASHYSGIDAGPLNMRRAKQMDSEVAKDFMSLFERYRTERAKEQEALERGDTKAALDARRKADEALNAATRADMSMTGVDPSKEDATGHARRMLLEHPGVFKFVGELTIKKEMVDVLLGGESFPVDAAAMDHFMSFANETGLGVLIHCDWGRHALDPHDLRPTATRMAYEHFDELLKLVAKYPNANIVLAHTGIGRLVRPDTATQTVTITRNLVNPDGTRRQARETVEVPHHMARIYEAMERAPHVKFDISWNDVAEAYMNDPGMRRELVEFIVRHPDRILFGSDTVKPVNPGHYHQALTTYLPLFADVAMRDPDALWMVLRGNYEDITARAQASVADWTRTQLRAQGRESEIAAMDEMLATLRAEREKLVHEGYETVDEKGDPKPMPGARESFERWVDQLYQNRYRAYAAEHGLPGSDTGSTGRTGNPMALASRSESAAVAAGLGDPVSQHWQTTHAHGQGTPRGKFDTVPARVVAGTLTTVATGSAVAGGSATLAATPDSVDTHLHATGFEARAGMGLLRTLYTDGVRLGWEQIFEEGRVTHKSLDRFVNRIIHNGKAFGLSEEKLKTVARLTEQFRVDYAYLANKPVDEQSGWTEQQKFNAIMATVGQYQIGVDRALGVQASSLNGLDPRTRTGQLFRVVTGATYGLNVAYAAGALASGNLSAVQTLIQAGFGASNAALMTSTFAGLGSGLVKSNWEARTPFRWMQTLGTSGLSASGAVWTLSDAANFFGRPTLHGLAEVGFGGLFTYAAARQAEMEWRKQLGLPIPGPSALSRPGYLLAAGVGLRVAMMYFDDEPQAADEQEWEPPRASGLPPLHEPAAPEDLGLPGVFPSPEPEGLAPHPTFVELGGGSGRTSTLWNLAAAHVERLLTPEERAAAGGEGNGVVLAALKQLVQINPNRQFRLDLMDGVAGPLPGDPDTIAAGTRLNTSRVDI